MLYDFKGQNFSAEDIKTELMLAAGEEYTSDMFIVLSTALNVPLLLPNFRTTIFSDYVSKWVSRYLGGFNKRPSLRTGNPPGTKPDVIISLIFHHLHKELTSEEVIKASQIHSKMMSIENIVGDMLEEFLYEKLKDKGWKCCWGSSIKAVDFCHTDGTLLQVKTSDNSENSSSSAIRAGTKILKWARRKSTQHNKYYWDVLQKITHDSSLSEANFRDFVKKILIDNPSCIYIKSE